MALERKQGGGGARADTKTDPRGRRTTRTPSPGGQRRSQSPGRLRLVEWGNKCFHCGSEKHTRDQCQSFAKMLAEAPHNKGKPADKRTPPPGYKSALGKARDEAKAKLAKTESKVAALTEADDTASDDDDGDFSQAGGSFRMFALRQEFTPVIKGPPPKIAQSQLSDSTNSENTNKFEPLTDEPNQEYDSEIMDAFNYFAHQEQACERHTLGSPQIVQWPLAECASQ